MLSDYVFSKLYWTEALTTACYTQNRFTIVKRYLKTPYEIFRGILPNISFLHVYRYLAYIHNHKGHLEKFDEKDDDGYFLGYLLVSKAFSVFNTRRQQIKETFHITFDESTKAIKFSKPSVDDITIAKSERYQPNEYLHHFESSQMYQVNSNVVQFIEPYNGHEPVVTEADAFSNHSKVMPLTYQDHSSRERPSLGVMKHTKLETQETSSKSVSRPVTVCDIKLVTYLIPTEVKINEQEFKIDELTKLAQMLMDEKINST
ncbi:retrovirus-related pol polyprotein from transposon TNT 1-94 [Tanacetum coccineum]